MARHDRVFSEFKVSEMDPFFAALVEEEEEELQKGLSPKEDFELITHVNSVLVVRHAFFSLVYFVLRYLVCTANFAIVRRTTASQWNSKSGKQMYW